MDKRAKHLLITTSNVMKQTKKQKGFTLLEMIIAMAIMAVLSTMVLLSFRNIDRTRRVQLATDATVSAFRQMQSFALSGKDIAASTCVVSGVAHKEAAYYYVSLSTSGTNDVATIYGRDKCNTNYSLQSYKLPKSTKFSTITIDATGVTSLTLYADPPFAVLTRDNSGIKASFASIQIVVSTSDSFATRTVTVDGISGRVE